MLERILSVPTLTLEPLPSSVDKMGIPLAALDPMVICRCISQQCMPLCEVHDTLPVVAGILALLVGRIGKVE